MSDADDLQDEFTALETRVSRLLNDLRPIDTTISRFLAGGQKCAQTIEQIYEALRGLETRLEILGFDVVGTIEELEAEAEGTDEPAHAP
jgi:hypothetical protein